MKEYQVIFKERGCAELVEIEPQEGRLGANEVFGHTLFSLVSAGTELGIGYLRGSFPSRPGYASVFEVEAVGEEVNDIKPGAVVFYMGPHRSYQRCGREEVFLVPDCLEPEKAVFARMMCVSMTTLSTTVARPPGRVMVFGLGVVGNLACQVFKHCGYEVSACEPIEVRREFARMCGIKSVFHSPPRELDGKMALVLECSGNEHAAIQGCRLLRRRGELVLVATPWERKTDIFAYELLSLLFHNYVVLRSGWEWELPRYQTDFRAGSIFENLSAGLKWLAEGAIRVEGLARKTSPAEARSAYEQLFRKQIDELTVLFDWREVD